MCFFSVKRRLYITDAVFDVPRHVKNGKITQKDKGVPNTQV